MKPDASVPKVIKAATYSYDVYYKNNPDYDRDKFAPVAAFRNPDGTSLSVYNAPLLRLLSQGFGIPVEVVVVPDSHFGAKLPDGNWTGMVGMVLRGEADITAPGLTMSDERREVVNFSYPIAMTSMGFMTDKAQPHPRSFAMFETFSPAVWSTVGIFLVLVSLTFYILLRRQKALGSVLLRTLGSLLEQELGVKTGTTSVSLVMLSWILGTAILVSSYKAVILSVLTFPTMVGIRDISDLAKASEKPSFQCFTYKGGIGSHTWQNYSDSRLRQIGKCVERNELSSRAGIIAFMEERAKKAYVGEKLGLHRFKRYYFMSDDSISLVHLGIAYSGTFCCPEMLNKIVLRISEGGLYNIHNDHLDMFDIWNDPSTATESSDHKVLSLEDLTGAFCVLVGGLFCAMLTFFIEILSKVTFCNKGKK